MTSNDLHKYNKIIFVPLNFHRLNIQRQDTATILRGFRVMVIRNESDPRPRPQFRTFSPSLCRLVYRFGEGSYISKRAISFICTAGHSSMATIGVSSHNLSRSTAHSILYRRISETARRPETFHGSCYQNILIGDKAVGCGWPHGDMLCRCWHLDTLRARKD